MAQGLTETNENKKRCKSAQKNQILVVNTVLEVKLNGKSEGKKKNLLVVYGWWIKKTEVPL